MRVLNPGTTAASETAMPKRFTVETANRTLPLVSRIVEDIVRDYAAWQDAVRDFEFATINSRAEEPDTQAEALQAEVQRLASDIESYLRELAQLGLEFKSFQEGLVDFPAESEGRTVYLCWHLGESSVRYWHEVDAGFTGRQPIESLVIPSETL
jgi:hypothetical protein